MDEEFNLKNFRFKLYKLKIIYPEMTKIRRLVV